MTVVFLLLVAGPVGPSISADTNPHAYFRQPVQCPRCHVQQRPKTEPGEIRTESMEFCLECHQMEELGVTHPLKIRPGDRFRGIAIPPDFVLSVDGKIICLTCHTGHGPVGNHFLRRSALDASGHLALCNGCHKTP